MERFEFSGGELCLDFANTGRYHPPERDDLPTYADLLDWSEQGKTLSPAECRILHETSQSRPEQTRSTLQQAQELRQAIYDLLSSIAAGGPAAGGRLQTIERAAKRAGRHYRLVERDGAFTWEVEECSTPPDLARPLWPIARSAAELLTSSELSKVRECASETCAWLFLDRSRNKARRWCDMKVCGNRSKARRHYARKRAEESSQA